jgi:hypothetical protein
MAPAAANNPLRLLMGPQHITHTNKTPVRETISVFAEVP